jgi:hypothetical protein
VVNADDGASSLRMLVAHPAEYLPSKEHYEILDGLRGAACKKQRPRLLAAFDFNRFDAG